VKAVLGLGANLGDRAAALQAAVDALAAVVRVVAVSAIYETAPVGGPEQPSYYNAVVVVDTELAPADLLDLGHRIEAAAGRVRLERWGPRTLDVDVLAYADVRTDDPDLSLSLSLPHPRAHERAFVLLPWLDVDPDARIPGRGSVAELADTVDRSGVHRLVEPTLRLREVHE
jgi:2-amino-4-hydroxy-6-hydroxymethyldihydropteridine diphosphokinase